MSLLSQAMQTWTIKTQADASDGMGGQATSWTDGVTIQAAVVKDASTTAKIAEKSGVTATYTITTARSVSLPFHTVLVRSTDGLVLRTTSKSNDKQTPASTSLDMRQVEAEEWSIPT